MVLITFFSYNINYIKHQKGFRMAGLFDYEFQLERINKHQPPLQKLDKIIDWDMFR
ncbi:MAG: hypothetical protein ACI81I_000849 [Arcobacteraceae bacterium]|jgi:hypothetical protein